MTIGQLINKLVKYDHNLPVYIFDVDTEEMEVSGLKYYEEEELYSDCCAAPAANEIVDGLAICSECKEHASYEGLPERVLLKV